ncbi:MAG: ornithine cyclodeaminase family protein [Acidobacteriales bacterium]|nr:ornithine cyclodeaminase family protein [Terriglobales bacterium]
MRAASQSGLPAAVDSSRVPRHLSDDDVRRLLAPAEAVAAIERAFKSDYSSFVIPDRQHIETADGVFLVMPCYNRATGRMGTKFVSVSNSAASGSTVQATYLLLDPLSAEPQVWLAANWLTDLRTAAASFVASRFLARDDARVLGIFGSGRQARAHVELFTRLRKFDRVLICGSASAQAGGFVSELKRDFNINAEAVEASECAAQSDLICTCTTASAPLFDGRVLRPGSHLNLIGAFQPATREVDSITISRARVVVDTYAGALREAGDVLIPMQEGELTRESITELHEIVSGSRPGRQGDKEITVFKSVGCALEDLAVAELIAARLEQASA